MEEMIQKMHCSVLSKSEPASDTLEFDLARATQSLRFLGYRHGRNVLFASSASERFRRALYR